MEVRIYLLIKVNDVKDSNQNGASQLLNKFSILLQSNRLLEVCTLKEFDLILKSFRKIFEKKINEFFLAQYERYKINSIGFIGLKPATPEIINVEGEEKQMSDQKKSSSEIVAKKVRKQFSHTATQMLREWFIDHLDDPYPFQEEKKFLASRTGLTQKQITNWFINQRMRKLAKRGERKSFSSKIQKELRRDRIGRPRLFQ